MAENLELCCCLEFLGLDQNATVEDANQSYAYLIQMINLLHSTHQDADQVNKLHDKLGRLEHAYQRVIDHIHAQERIVTDIEMANGDRDPQNAVKSIDQAAVALQNAKRKKAKADAFYSAAMDTLQKAIKIKRETTILWMEALERWNASSLNSSETCNTNSASLRGICQIWSDSERRKKPRISFVPGKNPVLTIAGKQYPVIDISREGIRFQGGPSFDQGRIIRGRLDLQGVPSINIVGKVIRNLDDQAAAKLITRIADSLVSNYPCQSSIKASG
jgi:hypothetical protein